MSAPAENQCRRGMCVIRNKFVVVWNSIRLYMEVQAGSSLALNGRKPEVLTIPELKVWLLSRGTPVKGKKDDLVLKLLCIAL